jgi:hypothetical protein
MAFPHHMGNFMRENSRQFTFVVRQSVEPFGHENISPGCGEGVDIVRIDHIESPAQGGTALWLATHRPTRLTYCWSSRSLTKGAAPKRSPAARRPIATSSCSENPVKARTAGSSTLSFGLSCFGWSTFLGCSHRSTAGTVPTKQSTLIMAIKKPSSSKTSFSLAKA